MTRHCWLAPQGVPRQYATVAPQSVEGQDTFAGHVWAVRSCCTQPAAYDDGGEDTAVPSGRQKADDAAPSGSGIRVIFIAEGAIGRLIVGDGVAWDSIESAAAAAAGGGGTGKGKRRRARAVDGILSTLGLCGCTGIQRGGDGWGAAHSAELGGWLNVLLTVDLGGVSDVPVTARTVAADFPWTFL